MYMYMYIPVLEGSSKLVGVDGELKTKVVIAWCIRENLDDGVLTEYIATLYGRRNTCKIV